MKAHTVKKLDDGDYEYRGIEFTRVDRLRGYSDHYQTWNKINGARAYAATRKELLAIIDRYIDSKENK